MAQYNPSVSIIMPVRNSEGHLSRCVESILNQTYESIDEWWMSNEVQKVRNNFISKWLTNIKERKSITLFNPDSLLNACILGEEIFKYFLSLQDWILKNDGMGKKTL